MPQVENGMEVEPFIKATLRSPVLVGPVDDLHEFRSLIDQGSDWAVDREGNLLIAHEGLRGILKVSGDRSVTPWATVPAQRPVALPRSPEWSGLALGRDGAIYLSDAANHALCRFDPAQRQMTHLVGGRRGCVDGDRETARLRRPSILGQDADGRLLVGEGAPWLRRVSLDGDVETLPAIAPGDHMPAGLLVTRSGLWLVADPETSQIYVSTDGRRYSVLTAVPQRGWRSLCSYENLEALEEARQAPRWPLVEGADGCYYLADREGHCLWRITPDGQVEPFVGREGWGCADRRAVLALFQGPSGLAVDRSGRLIVSDSGNARLRLVAPDGEVVTLVGDEPGEADGPASSARLLAPGPLVVDRDGVIWLLDGGRRICRVTPDGTVTTVWRSPDFVDRAGLAVPFDGPLRVTTGREGHVYTLETLSGRVREVAPDGGARTLYWPRYHPEVQEGRPDLRDLTVDAQGRLWGLDMGRRQVRSLGTAASNEAIRLPRELLGADRFVSDHAGGFYLIDGSRQRLFHMSGDGRLQHLAGGWRGRWDGQGAAARFSDLRDLALAPTGSLYVWERSRLMTVSPEGVVSTLFEDSDGYTDREGMRGRSFAIGGLAVAPDEAIWLGEMQTDRILRVPPKGPDGRWAPASLKRATSESRQGREVRALAEMASQGPYLERLEDLLGARLCEVRKALWFRVVRFRTERGWLQAIPNAEACPCCQMGPRVYTSRPSVDNPYVPIEDLAGRTVEADEVRFQRGHDLATLLDLHFSDHVRLFLNAALDGAGEPFPLGPHLNPWHAIPGRQLRGLEYESAQSCYVLRFFDGSERRLFWDGDRRIDLYRMGYPEGAYDPCLLWRGTGAVISEVRIKRYKDGRNEVTLETDEGTLVVGFDGRPAAVRFSAFAP